MIKSMKSLWIAEKKKHVAFLQAIYSSDDFFIVKVFKLEVYVTFLLPTRCLLLMPDWTFFFLPMIWFVYFTESVVITSFCFYLLMILLENVCVFVVYHYVKGGASVIDKFLYKKEFTHFFLGNTGS